MPKNAAIIVEIGGKLVIDRAMITNSCEGCFWSGIQVRGNTFVGQAPASNQGWLQMKNNSTIEHARIAVSNCNPDPAIFYGTTGGIIQCTNSRFVNNQNAVSMFAYTNIDAFGAFRPNLSYFQNCTFLLNDEYKGNLLYAAERMQSMVNLRGVEGITFAGCNFLNRNTNSFQKGIGNGILAWNAGFNITPYCASLFYSTSGCPDMRRTRFCGFTNGINTNGYASYDPGTSIDQADFDTVTVGVNVTKITNVSTTRCNFIVGHGHGLEVFDSRFCSQNIGILTQNTEQFRIEGNEFTGIPHHSDPTWFNFGTVVANTGNAMNKVRLCTYDSLTVGVYSLGINRSTRFPSSGLQILCNTFTANTTDISIENDGGTPVDKGIYVDQGTPGGLYPNSAGNTFSGATTPDLVNTSGNYINYYKNTSPETPVRAPLTLVNIYSAGTASCSSTLLDGSRSTGMSTASVATLDRSSLTAHKELFFTYKAAFEDSLSSHAGLIDFGNTASLLSTISASTDTATLYSTLVSGSPYISETAFRHIADLMKLPHLSMYQILQQNPDVLRNAPFVDYLDNIYSFSNNELSVLDAVKGTVTTRTWLERAIGNSKSLLDDEANIIMMALKTATDTNVSISDTTGEGICWDSTNVYYMLDSNAYYRDVDSMDVWLTNIGSTWAQYERVGYHNFKGDLTTADNVFLDIANNLPPTTIDTQSHEYYQVLWDVIRGAEYDDRDIYRLNSTEIAALDTYSTPAFTYYGARAVVFGMTTSGLAYTLYLPAWIEPCLSISSSGGLPSGKIGDNNQPGEQSNSDKFQFYAYPNPTSGIITFSYNVPDGSGDVTIVIKNIVGETVKELHTRNNAGTIKWNSDNLTSGVYLYSASNGKEVISNGKLILIK